MFTLTLMTVCGVRLETLKHQQYVLVSIQIVIGMPTGLALVLQITHAHRPTTELQAVVHHILFSERFAVLVIDFDQTQVFSESETKAAADALVDIVPQAYADVHAYSQYWMFPYGYKSAKCESYDKLMVMSKEIVDAIQAVHRTRFVYGPINEVIYVASGSSADYAYDTVGTVCSYAPELRDQVFLL